MAIILTQTDTAADNGFNVGCSGASSAGATTASREATEGGTAGSSEITLDPGGNGLVRACLAFQTDVSEPGTATWAAGNYVVRLNCTTSNNGTIWRETHICERTSGGTFNTVASLTGQTDDLATSPTVFTHTVNRATVFNADSSSSTLYIVCVFEGDDHGGTSFGITPDQNIDTPIVAASSQIIKRPITYFLHNLGR